MRLSSSGSKQGNFEMSLDDVAARVVALDGRLRGREAIRARELRDMWSGRLRPFWRLHRELYRSLARRFLEHGENFLATEVADEGGRFFGDDVPLILTRALATARSGAPIVAQEMLRAKDAVLAGADEAKSLLARTFKDLWKASGDRAFLERAFALYDEDYRTTRGDRTFPGVNAASMAFFLGRTDEARRIAGDVLAILRARPEAAGYWDLATKAECLLVMGEVDAAREAYSKATSPGDVAPAHLATTRAQARLLLRHLGGASDAFDDCFPLPGVIAFTGHRVDAAGRDVPRLPRDQLPEIAERIRSVLTKSGAGFGYSAAACGADIVFLECMQAAGLETFVMLPLPEDDFLRESVVHAEQADWVERFHAVTAAATEYRCLSGAGRGSMAFDFGNRLLLGAALQRARDLDSDLRVVAVWDGLPGAHGGTGDYVALARNVGCAVEVISVGSPGVAVAADAIRTDPDSDTQLLSVVSFRSAREDAALASLVPLVEQSQPVHREGEGDRVRLFFSSPVAAAKLALAARGNSAVNGAIALHVCPARLVRHPLTGGMQVTGTLGSHADRLSMLQPGDMTFASQAFAALVGLDRDGTCRAEFLGSRVLDGAADRTPIFRLVAR